MEKFIDDFFIFWNPGFSEIPFSDFKLWFIKEDDLRLCIRKRENTREEIDQGYKRCITNYDVIYFPLISGKETDIGLFERMYL